MKKIIITCTENSLKNKSLLMKNLSEAGLKEGKALAFIGVVVGSCNKEDVANIKNVQINGANVVTHIEVDKQAQAY